MHRTINMNDCKYLNKNICRLASDMAQSDCLVTEEQCNFCTNRAKPSRSINVVTVSLAIRYTKDKNIVLSQYANVIRTKQPPLHEKPGTELKNLISWFVWSKEVRGCTTCKNREDRMNKWGADKCEKNVQTIIAWLRESAVEKGYPFSERVASALIRRAIANSRKTKSSK
jgi:hypothetical protein